MLILRVMGFMETRFRINKKLSNCEVKFKIRNIVTVRYEVTL